ncbi:MAG: nucleotidyltransferase domain-containing protein [Sandaracinaceae bacterium]
MSEPFTTIFVTLAGSQAHGTAREGSDVDLRGVCVAPLATRLSLFRSFEQHRGELPAQLVPRALPVLRAHPTASRGLDIKLECEIVDVAKLLKLCAAANPNALEILFADPADWILEEPAWRTLHDARHAFLTRKVQQTFLGYAMAQLKRIRTHRAWLLDPPASRPRREDFGLPTAEGTLTPDDRNRIEESIASTVRGYGIADLEMPSDLRLALNERLEALFADALGGRDDLDERLRAVATHGLHLPPELAATLNAEKRYRSALKHWDSYRAWARERNPARADLERRFGYDTKHAMHLVRLMKMGLEALERGELTVRRPDAEELIAIREGALSYDALLEKAESMREALGRAAERTALPVDVDAAKVDALAYELMTTAG